MGMKLVVVNCGAGEGEVSDFRELEDAIIFPRVLGFGRL